jgi:hypothetical protein
MILYTILIIVANIVFNKSNDSCKLDLIFCVKWLQNNMLSFIIEILVYTITHLIVFFTALKYCTSIKKAKWTGLILSTSSYIYRIFTSHGYSETDHSKANMIISQIMLLLLGIIWLFLKITYNLWRCKLKRAKTYKQVINYEENSFQTDPAVNSSEIYSNTGSRKGFYAWTSFWITLWSLLFWFKIYLSCTEVNSGLMGKNSYKETEGECKMLRGPVCWHYTFDGLFKPMYWGGMSCENVVDILDYSLVA